MLLKRIGMIALVFVLLSSLCGVCLGASTPYDVTGTWMDKANWEEIIPISVNTYQVENAEQFAWLMNQLYQHQIPTFDTITIQLTGDDIDLSGKEWFPGGYNEEITITASVNLYGNNRVINGMTIGSKENPVTMNYVGLFPYFNRRSNYVRGIMINTPNKCQNLGVTNAAVYAKDCTYTGVFAGLCIADVNCCYATGTVDVTGSGIVGGFAGMISGSSWTNCFTDCTMSGDQAVAGGFFGYADNDCNLYSCYTNSSVMGSCAGAFGGRTLHTSFLSYDQTYFRKCYYNSENNPSIPAIYDVKKLEDSITIDFSNKLMGKTLAELQGDDFLTEINKLDADYLPLYSCFYADQFHTNKGLPVIINSRDKNRSTFKKNASATLPSDLETGNVVSIRAVAPTMVYYTLDGKKPTAESTPYTGPITLTKSAKVRILAVRAGCLAYYKDQSYTVPSFTDIINHPELDSICYVVKNGLFSGTSPTAFSPEVPMTRAMYVTVMGRLRGIDPSAYATEQFSDVPAGDWFSGYVAWAYENGIVTGTGPNSFSPQSNITNEQIAVLLTRYADFAGIEIPLSDYIAPAFSDQSAVNIWALASVINLHDAGILDGNAENRFDPRHETTRAEIAVTLQRFMALLPAADA